MIDCDRKAEFLGQIIDIFEDFLDSKNVCIENNERLDYADDDKDGLAIIFGADYDIIRKDLEKMMIQWGILSDENER